MRAPEHPAPDAHLTRTGIAGFDEILGGGFPRANVILVQGRTGSGKTLFGVEFVYRGALQFDEPGIIILFETSPDKLIRIAALSVGNCRNCKTTTNSRSSLRRQRSLTRSFVLRKASCWNGQPRWARGAFLSTASGC